MVTSLKQQLCRTTWWANHWAIKKDAGYTTISYITCFYFSIHLALVFFVQVSGLTNEYVYEDWVVEKTVHDSDGNEKKKKILVGCDKKTPGCRHRGDTESIKFQSTPGFVLAWLALLIIQGGHFGSKKPPSPKLWHEAPYSISIPYIRNTMTRDAYEFMRWNIHFARNTEKGKVRLGMMLCSRLHIP